MSLEGDVKKGEQVVLIDRDTNRVVWARAAEDAKFTRGGSALFDVSVIKGLRGVETMTVNVNFWDVYPLDDPALAEQSLKIMFEVK